MKQYLFFLLLGLALSLPHQNSESHGVTIASVANIDQLVNKDSLVLLFFSDNQCKNCEACSNAYAILSEINADIGSFLKIYLNSQNRAIFEQYKVTTFPRIIAFLNGKQYKSQFECFGSVKKMYRLMHKWLQRLNKPLKQWKGQEDHAHQLIVNCTSLQQKNMWKSVQQIQLWLDVYCGNKTFLGQNLAVVAENGRIIEAWQYKNTDHNETKEKIIKLIKAFKYKFVMSWNVAIAQQIFVHNQSSFVMIINNETLSQRFYGYYESIKQKWYENTDKYQQPILFAAADLSTNTYEAIRLKRYLTGVDTAHKKQYIYPILAFIQRGDKPNKYLLYNSSSKTKQQIQSWAQSIYNHVVLKQQYAQGDQKLSPWFYEDHKDRSKRDPSSFDNQYEVNMVKYVKNHSDWQELLSIKNTQPFFVYFTWRYSYQLQKLESQLLNWWKDYSNYIVKNNSAKLIIHILHTVDIPVHQGLTLSYVPSFCLINENKQVQMMHGVTDLAKIKEFVTNRIIMKEQFTPSKFQ